MVPDKGDPWFIRVERRTVSKSSSKLTESFSITENDIERWKIRLAKEGWTLLENANDQN